jgi:hypothetical protein
MPPSLRDYYANLTLVQQAEEILKSGVWTLNGTYHKEKEVKMNTNVFKVIITEPEGGDDSVHIHGIGGYVSLCGWCDVPYITVEDSVTCPKCIALIKFCKSIKIEDLR